jgi:CheY-like chemotaxis protein
LSEGDTLPDLILVDLRMPVLEGFEFLDFFNHLSFPGKDKIKIVVLSSSGLREDIERAKELGAIDSIVKPLNEQKLRKILETYFHIS